MPRYIINLTLPITLATGLLACATDGSPANTDTARAGAGGATSSGNGGSSVASSSGGSSTSSGTAGATVDGCSVSCTDLVRQVDFETNDLSQPAPGDVTGAASIVNEPVHCGHYAVSLSAPPKADVRMWSIEARDLWLSYWIYLPSDWNGAGAWQMLHEWCPGVSPFCDIHILLGFQDKSGIEDNLNLYYIWAAGDTGQLYANVAVPRGRWVHFKSFAHWDETAGQIQVWMDGVPVLGYNGRTTMNLTTPSPISIEVGSYRDSSYAPSPMYLDDIVVCGSEL